MTAGARALLLTVLALMTLLAALTPRTASADPKSEMRDAHKVTDDGGACVGLKPFTTDINIDLVQADPVYDNNDSWANLKNNAEQIRTTWLDSGRLKDLWVVNDLATAGLAFAGMDAIYDFEVAHAPVDKYGVYFCDYFKTISVQLLYRSVIKIPNDFKPGSCGYEVIGGHEEMLVNATKNALETNIRLLRGDIPQIAGQMEAGMVGQSNLEGHEFQMKNDIQEAVEIYIKDTMSAKMKEAAAAVDTHDEFTALNAALADCKKKEAPPPPKER